MDLEYLKKYNNLPKELRDKINSPAVSAGIENLERQFSVSLAPIIMKVMIGDISIAGLKDYFIANEKIDQNKAEKITGEIKEKVLFAVSEYLNLGASKTATPQKTSTTGIQAPEKEFVIDLSSDDEEIKTADRRPEPANANPQFSAAPSVQAPVSPERVIGKEASTRGSSFFFAPEDEEEIREVAKKTIVGEIAPAPSIAVDEKVDRIMKVAEINFGSEFLVDRFKQILRTYVKGIRTAIDTKITFKKPFDSGGLSFDEESVEKIMSIASGVLAEDIPAPSLKPQKISVPEDVLAYKEDDTKNDNISSLKNIGVRDVDYDFSRVIKKNEEQKIKQAEAQKENSHAEMPASDEEKNEAVEYIFSEEAPATTTNVRQTFEPSGKVRMDDIKYVPVYGSKHESAVMTPIDELRNMDLLTFRRLGQQDAFRAVTKIKSKIDLLEEEDYNKKIEGIKAWRMSPVNKLYLGIGEQSISQNKAVDVIMAERKFANQEVFSTQEFEAIMDLNKKLRF